MSDGYQTRQHIDAVLRQYPNLEPWDLQRLVPDNDVPSNMGEGWKLGRISYQSDGIRRGGISPDDYVVTRPGGYVPYQSVVQPAGRYAYDPNQDQYPRTMGQELISGRTAV